MITTEEFIEKAKKKHGDSYDYSDVNYIDNITKITITHKKCGNKFSQSPGHHMSGKGGCKTCGVKKTTIDSFIKGAIDTHGDSYDYSTVEYVNNKTKISIIHKICNKTFEQTPFSHLSGKGCSYCFGRVNDMKSFLEKAEKIHGAMYDYSQVNYVGATKKVIIIHNKCKNRFLQTPAIHLDGHGCPLCAKKGPRSVKTFIERAIEVHGDEYDYSDTNFINNKSKVIIIHKKCGRRNEQLPGNHLAGKGCCYCAGPTLRTTEIFIEKARNVHGYEYDYSCVNYVKGTSNVTIIHKKCRKKFLQAPVNHLSGSGCIICSKTAKKTTETFIQESQKIHGDEYDYSLVNYTNIMNHVTITHKKCGNTFIQKPTKHLSGHGCLHCSGTNALTTDLFIQRAKITHEDEYDYTSVNYLDSYQKVTIIHKKCGNTFMQLPHNHLKGQGCPKCKMSRGEIYIGKYLEKKNIDFVPQKRFPDCKNTRELPFDFYIPYINLIIEYDGAQHYMPVEAFGGQESYAKRIKNDIIKNIYCLENKIYLFRIIYDEDIEERMNFIYDYFIEPEYFGEQSEELDE